VSVYPDRYSAVLGLVYFGDPAAAAILDARIVARAPQDVLRRLRRSRLHLLSAARRGMIERTSRIARVRRHQAGPHAETSAANAPPGTRGFRIGSGETR
jgi:hypothetical protein